MRSRTQNLIRWGASWRWWQIGSCKQIRLRRRWEWSERRVLRRVGYPMITRRGPMRLPNRLRIAMWVTSLRLWRRQIRSKWLTTFWRLMHGKTWIRVHRNRCQRDLSRVVRLRCTWSHMLRDAAILSQWRRPRPYLGRNDNAGEANKYI